MAVQAPLFLDHLGFPYSSESEFGLPDPFSNLVQPVRGDLLLQKHCDETEFFLKPQKESLRRRIEELNKRHVAALSSSIEAKLIERWRRTEQDLAELRRRRRELEDGVRMAEMENQRWQRKARENEGVIMGLRSMLGQAQERLRWAGSAGGPAQDEESTCECEEKIQKKVEVGKRKMECKWCKNERSSVVFLPCKHLCACRQCERVLGMCPVCKCVKEGSVQVLME